MKARGLLFNLILAISFSIIAGLATAQAQTEAPRVITPSSVFVGPPFPITQPDKSVINPGNNKLYVSGSGGRVDVINAINNTTITHIGNTNGGAGGMFVNPSNNQIIMVSGSIQVIDGNTDTLLKTISPPSVPGALPGTQSYDLSGYNP